MTYHSPSPSPNHKVNKRAIAWALFSQSVWLPALFTDTQDYISSKNNDYDFSAVASLPNQNLPPTIIDKVNKDSQIINTEIIAQTTTNKNTSGIILNATIPPDKEYHSKLVNTLSEHGRQSPIAFTPAPPHPLPELSLVRKIESFVTPSHPINQSSDLLRRLYSHADLLGGTLTLGDLNEPMMPPIARAEKAQHLRSGDPLSPIPGTLREPMRRALKELTPHSAMVGTVNQDSVLSVDQARVVHVPSSKLKRQIEVPLALQSDGSVDILNVPEDPAVVEEIKTWSTKQQLPSQGRMLPAVIHLHPLTEMDESRPQPASAVPSPGGKSLSKTLQPLNSSSAESVPTRSSPTEKISPLSQLSSSPPSEAAEAQKLSGSTAIAERANSEETHPNNDGVVQ